MTDLFIQESSTACRRCGRDYVLPSRRAILPACPHCGAAPVPLRKRLKHNGVSAILSVLALIVLSIAINLPFMSMSRLDVTRQYSLLDGIMELFQRKEVLIGTILLVFSVIFPFAKLIALLIATSALVPISSNVRHRLHWLATVTGKYSLLDLLVVAIIIVLVKFEHLTEARALPGTTLFCVAILLSICAGFAVNLDIESEAQ